MTTGRTIERNGKHGYVISTRDPVSGKYKQIWRTGFDKKGDAQKALRNHLNTLDDASPPTDMTVAEWLQKWIAEDCRDSKPMTRKSYQSCVKTHIIPAIGKIRLDKLTHKEINTMYEKVSRNLAPATVQRIHKTLRTALNRAVKRGFITVSPIKRADSPEGGSPRRGVLSVEVALRVLDELRGHNVAYYGCYLAIYAGLRRGEVCGLQWWDVEWERNTIHIRRTRQRPFHDDVIIEPKTTNSVRDIVISSDAMDELRRWRDVQRRAYQWMGMPWSETNYVVVIDGELTPPHPNKLADGLRHVLRRLQLPVVTFHDLRHTHATWMLESGVDLKTVSQRLGHASITITADTYAHVTDRMQRDAVDKLDAMISSRRAKL